MADIELVIKIPEKTIAHIRSNYGHGVKCLYDFDKDIVVDAIWNGTPLPKGHGRLIDANEVSKYVIIGNADLKKCPTIIEADKENEKGVLEQMIAKTQKTLLDSTKAWSNYIDKNGNIY